MSWPLTLSPTIRLPKGWLRSIWYSAPVTTSKL